MPPTEALWEGAMPPTEALWEGAMPPTGVRAREGPA
jgi:hypothetical protein